MLKLEDRIGSALPGGALTAITGEDELGGGSNGDMLRWC